MSNSERKLGTLEAPTQDGVATILFTEIYRDRTVVQARSGMLDGEPSRSVDEQTRNTDDATAGQFDFRTDGRGLGT